MTQTTADLFFNLLPYVHANPLIHAYGCNSALKSLILHPFAHPASPVSYQFPTYADWPIIGAAPEKISTFFLASGIFLVCPSPHHPPLSFLPIIDLINFGSLSSPLPSST